MKESIALRCADTKADLHGLDEIKIGREVMISSESATPNPDDAAITILGEVSRFDGRRCVVIGTSYAALPEGPLRLDLGSSVATFDRMDMMLALVQRCEGPSKTQQRSGPRKMGLLLTGTNLADAIFANISASVEAAVGWDPLDALVSVPADTESAIALRRAAAAKASDAPRRVAKSVPNRKLPLNESQRAAVRQVIDGRRLTLIQGPPGTGKTSTCAAIVCAWLKAGCGPILCTAFSNKGTDNLGVRLFVQ